MQGPKDGRSLKPPRRAVPVESWRPVALLVATGVVAAFQIGKIPLSLNYLQSDFGFDLVMAGWVASLFAVMGAVCAVLLSFTLSVFGLKPMLLSGLMISMCASLLGGMTPDVSWLLVTRAFEGLGFILCVLCLPPLIGQLAPKGQSSAAMAYWAMYLPLGTCVMLLISAVILPIFSWRVVWVVSAIALLGMAWLIARLDVQQKDSGVKTVSFVPQMGLHGWLYLTVLASCFAVYTAQYYVFANFLPKIFRELSTDNMFQIAAITAIFIALNAGGNFFSGILHRAGVASWALICTASVGLALLAPLVLAEAAPIGLRLAASALLSFVSGFVPSSLFAAIPRLSAAPSVRTFINAGLVQASAIGQLIGAPLVGFVVARSESWLAAAPLIWGAAGLIFLAAMALRILSKDMPDL